MRSLICAVFPLVLAVAACSGQAPERGKDAREAEGEVLGGTISDQMLPLDQLQSQSPVLRRSPAETAQEGEAVEGEEGAAEEGDTQSEPSPASDDEAPAGE
jgi:hypothetical protein